MFPFFHSQVKGESHASVCGSRSHALIPTGARSRPAALPKPIIISVPRPHCWKGSASKPYVELPPHTAPLGMEVGPAQACALKVVVHDLIRIRPKPIKKERTMKLKLAPSHLVVETPAAPPDLPKNRTCEFPRIRLKWRARNSSQAQPRPITRGLGITYSSVTLSPPSATL